jgi:glutathione S-transferase
VKLNESLVLVEFIADLYPESGLLPTDPVLRAKARLFIDAVTNKLAAVQHKVTDATDDGVELLVQALESLQALLPSTGYAVGEFSIADIAIAPSLARMVLRLENDLGNWPAGEGKGPQRLAVLKQPKLARFWEYAKELQARPSFFTTWDKVRFASALGNR